MTDETNYKSIVEAMLFVVGDEGITLRQLADVLNISKDKAQQCIDALQHDYNDNARGMALFEVDGTYQLATKSEHVAYIKKLFESPSRSTLSQAALETLAIIAYKQPITRAEIEEVRGVKTERPLQTLMTKHLIDEVGRADGTGRAILYGTTSTFLDAFALTSLSELPPLPDDLSTTNLETEADLFFETFQETINQ